MLYQSIMLQGTGSGAGKSLFTLGLCRLLLRKGFRPAPFQVITPTAHLNLTESGQFVARTQALQALAAGTKPRAAFSPIIVKPHGPDHWQIYTNGVLHSTVARKEFNPQDIDAMRIARTAYGSLNKDFDVIIIDGLANPSDNPFNSNICNFGFAEAVDCPVLFVACDHYAGTLANITGTFELLKTEQKKRIRGMIINRPAPYSNIHAKTEWIEFRTQKSIWGIVPEFHVIDNWLEEGNAAEPDTSEPFRIAIPALPHLAYEAEFDTLKKMEGIELQFVQSLPQPNQMNLVIIPSSADLRADVNWLIDNGWQTALQTHRAEGKKIIGVGAGLYMLGQSLIDPKASNAEQRQFEGLGMLDLSTTLTYNTELTHVDHAELMLQKIAINGQEVCAGFPRGPALNHPAMQLKHRFEGAIDPQQNIFATSIHGILKHRSSMQCLLNWSGYGQCGNEASSQGTEARINQIADLIEAHVDLTPMHQLIGLPRNTQKSSPAA